jgi:hypothetical protein
MEPIEFAQAFTSIQFNLTGLLSPNATEMLRLARHAAAEISTSEICTHARLSTGLVDRVDESTGAIQKCKGPN